MQVNHGKRLKKGIAYFKKKGIKASFNRLITEARKTDVTASNYEKFIEKNSISDEEYELQKKCSFGYEPLISILVPTYNTPKRFLVELIGSLFEQSYQKWELCIADGSTTNEVEEVCESYSNDSRIIYKRLEENNGISENTNQAFLMSHGEYISFLDHDDILSKDALFEVVKALNENRYDFLYSDEDKITEDSTHFIEPHFKPDFSVDLIRSHNYITHFVTLSRELFLSVGKLEPKYDGAQDYDFVLRCTERTKKIKHISKVLYHWRISANSTAQNVESKLYAYEAGKKVLEDYYYKKNIDAKVESTDIPGIYHTTYNYDNSFLSVVIYNCKENSNKKKTIDSIRTNYDNQECEIITYMGCCFDNELSSVIKQAKGDLILLIEAGVCVASKNSIPELIGCCNREEVAVACGKLFSGKNVIINNGLIVDINGLRNSFEEYDRFDKGPFFRGINNCNITSTSKECFMLKKIVFEQYGEFDKNINSLYNVVDFCLFSQQKGYVVVFNAYSDFKFNKKVESSITDSNFHDILVKKYESIIKDIDQYYNKNLSNNEKTFMLNYKE